MPSFKRISDLPNASVITGDELIEVSQPSATVRSSGTTFSAAAADNSINDSASGFLVDGFAAGDRVRVTGFSTAGNNFVVGVITSVTAGKIVIGGTPAPVLANEAAGAVVTVEKWTSRKVDLASALSGSGNYDIGLFVAGRPANSELVCRFQATRDFSFPVGLAGSFGSARVASTGSVSFNLLRNGVSFATLAFASSDTGAYTSASGAAFVEGDILTIVAPATADATLEDISINLKGSAA
jgi:hypothetical protein